MTSNEEVLELASFLLLLVATYQIPDALQCIGIGVMRGMQDVRVIPIYSFIAYWVCNIPVSYLCAFYFDMGAGGLYVGFVTGLRSHDTRVPANKDGNIDVAQLGSKISFFTIFTKIMIFK